MNFRKAFLDAHEASAASPFGSARQQTLLKVACATGRHDHPRLWAMLEHITAQHYEKASDEHITARFDWQAAKPWLVDHWFQLVSALCSVISLFFKLAPAPEDQFRAKSAPCGPKGILPDFGPFVEMAQDTLNRADAVLDRAQSVVNRIDTALGRVLIP